MRFDINRLSRLAGISGTSTSGNRGLISEAGNRSYNEDPGLSKEVDVLFGKNQLNETDADFVHADEFGHGDDIGDTYAESDIPDHKLDEILVINENDLRRELANLKRRRVEENRLRGSIRKEIGHILDEVDLNTTGGWVYGKNKPARTRKGYVARGFKGIGFR